MSDSDSDAPIVRPSTSSAARRRPRPAAAAALDDEDDQTSSAASNSDTDPDSSGSVSETDEESANSNTNSDTDTEDDSEEASDDENAASDSSPIKPRTAKRSRHVRRLDSSSSSAAADATEPQPGPSSRVQRTSTSSGSDIVVRPVAKRLATTSTSKSRRPAIVYDDDSSESSDSSWNPLDDVVAAAVDPQQPSTSAAARRQDELAAAAAAAAAQAAAAAAEPGSSDDSSSASDDNADDASNPNHREKCPICLHSFRSQPLGRPSACEHSFCLCCIEEWSRNVQTCPIDRLPFSAIGRYERGQLVGEIAVEARTTELDVGDGADADDVTACEVCRATDREDTMLLCDGCNRGYHMDCLHPALEEIPANAWYCDYCFDSEAEEAEEDAAAIGELLSEMRELGEPATRLRARPAAVPATDTPRITRTRQSERIRATILSRIAPSRRHAPVGVRESALGMPLPGESY